MQPAAEKSGHIASIAEAKSAGVLKNSTDTVIIMSMTHNQWLLCHQGGGGIYPPS